jgi:hypothetical protein
MTNMIGFFSLLTLEQRLQILENLRDFNVSDPNVLLLSTQTLSKKNKGKTNGTKTSKDS